MIVINNDDFIANEFSGIKLGDKRLSDRLIKIAERFSMGPKHVSR